MVISLHFLYSQPILDQLAGFKAEIAILNQDYLYLGSHLPTSLEYVSHIIWIKKRNLDSEFSN